MANPVVILDTSMGEMHIELNEDKAPLTVDNFLKYADDGFYDSTIFHRVIPNFMVQGGGFTEEDMSQKATREPIKNEADNGLSNEAYTIAMARTSVVDSATAQFFINVADNTFLDHGSRDFGYAVFGKVIKGKDVVDRIAAVETGRRAGMSDVPTETVTINSARRA